MDDVTFGSGEVKLDKRIVEAAQKALGSPCAICGETEGIVARQFTPRKPQLFCIPEGVGITVGLCAAHLYIEAADVEAYLLVARILQAGQFYGWSYEDL